MKARKPELRESVDASELGAMMREVRENLGHDLKDVAEDLRIRLVYLEAIEAGRLSALPGSAYVSGFIRSYSEFLGLDGEEIVRRFRMAGIQISGQTSLHLPSPVEEGRLPTAAILLAAAIVAAVAYGGWYYLSSDGSDPAGLVDRVPADLSGIAGGAGQAPVTNGAPRAPGAGSSGAASPPATVPGPAPPPEAAAEPPAPSLPAPSSQAQPPQAASPEAAVSAPPVPAPPVPAPAVSEPAVSEPAVTTPGAPPIPQTPQTPAPATQGAAIPGAPASVAATERPESPPESSPASPPLSPPASPAATPLGPLSAGTSDGQTRDTPSSAGDTPPAVLPSGDADPGAAGAGVADGSDPDVTPPPSEVASETAATVEAGTSEPDASPVLMPAAAPTAAPVAAPAGPPAAPVAAAAPATTARGAALGRRIVIRALAESYVAVLTDDNQTLFSQLMKPGDSYEVPSGANLVLQTGNAGGLQLTVDGRRVPTLGQIGDVRDNVQLDADILLGTPR